MIENYRSDLIWKTMKTNPYIVAGLKKAGFTGGWLNTMGATAPPKQVTMKPAERWVRAH